MESDSEPESSLPVSVVTFSARRSAVFLLLTKTFKRDADKKPILDDEITETWTDAPIRSTGNFCNLFASESPPQ